MGAPEKPQMVMKSLRWWSYAWKVAANLGDHIWQLSSEKGSEVQLCISLPSWGWVWKSQRKMGKRSRKYLENKASGCGAAPRSAQAERSLQGFLLGFRDIYMNSGRRSWVRELC